MPNPSKVTLVGAGPGSPDLITVRGMNALQTADVVLYDALVNEELLRYASQAVRKIYVGKRAHQHAYPQEKINEMMAEMALRYGHVVRLKGGDPFVFGRAFEEISYLTELGIATQVIPGLSSATSLSGLQHIPLTHRGISEGFCVVTGTTKSGALSQEVVKALEFEQLTLVILMGFQKLGQLAALYRSKGKGDLPVAVVQNGSLKDEKIALGTMETIEQQVAEAGLTTPAVIIIGKVVELHTAYQTLRNEYTVFSN